MRTISNLSAAVAMTLLAFMNSGVAANAQDFPQDRPINILVPFSPGGSVDISARLLAPLLEEELGTTVQVLNRPGAGSQVGINELVRAAPDGHTMGYTILPLTITTYLNPHLNAAFDRDDMQPLAMHTSDAQYLTVLEDSRFESAADIIEAGKANPGEVTTSATGRYSPEHLAILQLEEMTGADFAMVFFDGGSAQTAALLGGHIDFQLSTLGNFTSAYKNGQVRFLGVAAREEEERLPGIDTLESQGYPIFSYVSRGLSVPAGTPEPIVQKLSDAISNALESAEHQQKMSEMNMSIQYMDPESMAAFWDDLQQRIEPLLQSEVSD